MEHFTIALFPEISKSYLPSANGAMSGLTEANWNFITLLLSGDSKQQKALIDSISPHQVDTLSEIFHNLAHVLELEPSQTKFMQRRLSVIKDLSQVSKSRRYRKALIQKHRGSMLKILDYIKDDLVSHLHRRA